MSSNPFMARSFTQKELKDYGLHTKTIGAYVQEPLKGILGIAENEVIASVDAKSLYPTIMAYGNIGYDTLFGRVYDADIVEKILEFIVMLKGLPKDRQQNGIKRFRQNICDMIKNSKLESKNSYLNVAPDFYSVLFSAIVNHPAPIQNILKPCNDVEHDLLKCCLFPILEAITWLHRLNPGYNKTCYDYIFYQADFYQKYKNKKFYVMQNCNSVHIQLRVIGIDDFYKYYARQFLINPFGTLFYRHYDKKSFEVDLILDGMSDRKTIKDRGLILGAVSEAFNHFSDETKFKLYETQGKLDEVFVNKILDVIGDADAKVKSKQFKTLTGIDFQFKEKIDKMDGQPLHLILQEIMLHSEQDMGTQNALKTNLNSGYGIFAMPNWDYGNCLVSNSITAGGKIVGIKFFQQISHNVLQNERESLSA